MRYLLVICFFLACLGTGCKHRATKESNVASKRIQSPSYEFDCEVKTAFNVDGYDFYNKKKPFKLVVNDKEFKADIDLFFNTNLKSTDESKYIEPFLKKKSIIKDERFLKDKPIIWNKIIDDIKFDSKTMHTYVGDKMWARDTRIRMLVIIDKGMLEGRLGTVTIILNYVSPVYGNDATTLQCI